MAVADMFCTYCGWSVQPSKARPSLDHRYALGICAHCSTDERKVERQLVATREAADRIIDERRERRQSVLHQKHLLAGAIIKGCKDCRALDPAVDARLP